MVIQQEVPSVVRAYVERAKAIPNLIGVWYNMLSTPPDHEREYYEECIGDPSKLDEEYRCRPVPAIYNVIRAEDGNEVLDITGRVIRAVWDSEKEIGQRVADYPVWIESWYDPKTLEGMLAGLTPIFRR